jgi:hypothetical protein
MVTGADVLSMLIPQGGWIITGEDYEGIEFIECEPITKKQYVDGFAQFEAWKAEQDAAKAAIVDSRNAKLIALGLTAEELGL